MTLQREAWLPLLGVLGAGAILGLIAAHYPLQATALAIIAAIGAALVFKPVLGVPLVFASIALANASGPVLNVGIPLTLSKLAVMGALGCWGAHALLTQKPLVRFNRLTPVMLLPIASTALSMTGAGSANSIGINFVLGCAMLVMMVHYFDTVLEADRLPEVGWYMSLVFVGTLIVGAFTAEPVTEIYSERASGVFDNANLWAALILCTAPVLIGLIRKHRHWTAEVFIWAIVILVPINLFLTMSRTGFVSYLVTLPILVILLWDRRYKLLIAFALLAIIAPTFADPTTLITRYGTLLSGNSEFESSMQLRQDSIAYGMKLFFAHPLMGVGAGAFERQSILASSGLAELDPHNHYVRILAEEGVVGALANLAFVGAIAWAIFHRLQARFTPMTRSVATGLLGSLVSLAMFGMGADMMTFAPAWAVFGVGLVLLRDPGASEGPAAAVPAETR